MNPLDIAPLKDKRRNCADDIVASLCAWLGRDYEFMYAGALNFSYRRAQSSLIGKRIVLENNKLNYLSNFHGVTATINPASASESLAVIKSELAKNYPVGLAVDAFYCPWDASFNKQHSIHHFLVVGYYDDLIITDPYYEKQNVSFPLEYFFHGCNSYSITYSITETPELQLTEAVNVVGGMIQRYIDTDPFRMMKHLADDITASFEPALEKHGYTHLWEAPIAESTWIIMGLKFEFAMLMDHLYRRYGAAEFETFARDIQKIGTMWATIQGIIMKILMSENAQQHIQYANNASKLLYEVADREEAITREVLHKMGGLMDYHPIRNSRF